jgi:A/G-specific adenine glycosylase
LSTQPNADPDCIEARRRALLAWYDRQGRHLPWRGGTDVYGTWIAEIMLQQTTVEAVRPRWEAFLRRFPDVHALAGADEADVLAAWSGLGYYRRARLLHRAARAVVAAGGDLPDDHAGWRALPGVGDYAAGAIASIGLGLPEPAIDANVRRVLLRWHCRTPEQAGAVTPRRLRDLAVAHLPTDRPGDWNQALMDLGAGPCRARGPRCGECPVRQTCAAGRAGTADRVPAPVQRRPAVAVTVGVLVLLHGPRVLLLPAADAVVAHADALGAPHREDLAGLFGGMLALPSTPWYPAPDRLDVAPLLAAWRHWLDRLGASAPRLRHVGAHAHTITHHRLQVVVTSGAWPDDSAVPRVPAAAWWRPDAPGAPISTLARRSLGLAAGPSSTAD